MAPVGKELTGQLQLPFHLLQERVQLGGGREQLQRRRLETGAALCRRTGRREFEVVGQGRVVVVVVVVVGGVGG